MPLADLGALNDWVCVLSWWRMRQAGSLVALLGALFGSLSSCASNRLIISSAQHL